MKLCQTCNIIIADKHNYCAHDGQPLVEDVLATALQDSVSSKYTVTHLIGIGSMGAVYRAEHHALGDVAIKVMLGPPDNHKLSERFLREARALRMLQTPHAVLVYDLERSPAGLTYMVMEMIKGRSLRDELKERGHLLMEETVEIAEAACDALEAAHERGIIHRDLKPDNILLAEGNGAGEGEMRFIKIVDFGIVKLRGTQQGGEDTSMQLTNYGTPIGTPFYMSPEQWFGDGPGFTALDGRTDIYALGCTLYEALSGQPPFLGNTKEELRRKHLNEQPRPLSEVAAHVPASVSRVIMRALEKDRDFRPAHAAEFARELRRAWDESKQTEAAEEAGINARVELKSPVGDTEQSSNRVPDRRAQQQEGASHGNGQTSSATAQPVELEDMEETLEPGVFRFEAGSLGHEQLVSTAHESELRRTLLTTQSRRSPETAFEGSQETQSRAGREVVLAQAGEWHIGLFAEEVESISDWRTPIPLPHAPPAVLGVVSVRSRMLTVIDPAALLGEGSAGTADTTPAFIIELRGDEQLALAVNQVVGAIRIFAGEIELPAQAASATVMRGVFQGAHGRTIMLDSREIFDAAMRGAERRRQRS
jgi:serine/threonine protein kinase/chemotaxis signal transduction protein